jgi:hypothetical protein
LPELVGVPEISPVELRLNPGGNKPEIRLKLIGACPPVVCSCCVYVCPTVAVGSGEVVVIVKGAQFIVMEVLAGSGGNGGKVHDKLLAVIVYMPGSIYVWLVLRLQVEVVQVPTLTRGDPSPKLVSITHDGAPKGGKDAEMFTVTF